MHAVAHQRAGVPPNRDDSATPHESSSPPRDEPVADLPAENAARAGTGAVSFMDSVLEDMF